MHKTFHSVVQFWILIVCCVFYLYYVFFFFLVFFVVDTVGLKLLEDGNHGNVRCTGALSDSICRPTQTHLEHF